MPGGQPVDPKLRLVEAIYSIYLNLLTHLDSFSISQRCQNILGLFPSEWQLSSRSSASAPSPHLSHLAAKSQDSKGDFLGEANTAGEPVVEKL
jgi:hypothetical protein